MNMKNGQKLYIVKRKNKNKKACVSLAQGIFMRQF